MAARHLIIFAFALLICVQNANSLTCHWCKMESCKGNVTQAQNCTAADAEVCISMSNPKTGKVMGKGCHAKDFCDIYASCKSCTSDFCNSTPTILPSFLLIGLSAFVAARFFQE